MLNAVKPPQGRQLHDSIGGDGFHWPVISAGQILPLIVPSPQIFSVSRGVRGCGGGPLRSRAMLDTNDVLLIMVCPDQCRLHSSNFKTRVHAGVAGTYTSTAVGGRCVVLQRDVRRRAGKSGTGVAKGRRRSRGHPSKKRFQRPRHAVEGFLMMSRDTEAKKDFKGMSPC